MKRGHARILAFESSCDETATAIVEDGRRTIAQGIASQIDMHALYGGVVPEIASRMHVEALCPLLDEVLRQGSLTLDDIDAVAVTNGPGLVGALLTGVAFAKGLAWAKGLPLIAVNHIEGHVSANYIAHPELEPPFICLVASGGHSHIVKVADYGHYEVLGHTTDDAAGEAFDKVARVLSIPYPGGPLLDRLAETGDDRAYTFPSVHTPGRYDFSFSGLKTHVINLAHNMASRGESMVPADFAASFRRAVVASLVEKSVLATVESGLDTLCLAGGVASNLLLRREISAACEKAGIRAFMPQPLLCTDNAQMIGSAAFYNLMSGRGANLSLNAQPAADMCEW
ncbi:MAG: tRNA (adenosine(37)-N6)-threonylcarbamoyltransferase complex transferase subunit TsaD [Clostridia bacterium]|nr:tRNA (adenosine(37)-N6)-threonylcarbamoyltransferase complex transferase subunit TsaD [Clostridia bacterium]